MTTAFMKQLLILLLLLPVIGFSQTLSTSSIDEANIMQTIDDLFEGMNKSDSVKVLGTFAPGASLQSVVNKDGVVSVRTDSISGFARSIGRAKPGDLEEKIDPYQIMIDTDLATAFIPYRFIYKGQLHHCGANAFTLVKIAGTWKIQAIIDTRRECM
jgi:hypothetical protein